MGLVAKAFQDIITFSRASSGTYVNSNGYITNSSVLNYLTYSNAPENAAWTKSNSFVQQNLFLYSQEFDNANWALLNVAAPTSNTTIAPDGTLTADTVTASAGTASRNMSQSSGGLALVPMTVSVYAKANTLSFLQIFHGSAGTAYANFNLSTGAVGTVGGTVSATISNAGNGWYRCSITLTPSAASSIRLALISSATAVYNESWAAAGTESIFLWGAQCVQGSVPGDYRATTSAALPCLYADYNGALRARKLCEDNVAAVPHRIFQGPTTVGTSSLSIVAKAAERSWVYLRFIDASSTIKHVWFNLATGTLGTIESGMTGSIQSAGNGYYRCTFSGPALVGVNTTLIGVTNADATVTYTGDGSSGIYIADAQLNDGSSALAYYDTTASAYNAPRFDYDPVTLAAKGLLVEEQRANLLLQSNDFQTSWTQINITRTLNSILSPSGNVDGVKLTATASAVTTEVQGATVAATAATGSVYVKQGTGATTANLFALRNQTTLTDLIVGSLNYSTGVFTYTTGSTGVVVTNAGNGWWRIALSATTGITSGDTMRLYVGFPGIAQTAGDFLYAYGAQLEAGAFATSYIPTVASQVTRAADVASVNTLSPWYNGQAGTWYVEADTQTYPRYLVFDGGGASKFPLYVHSLSSNIGTFDGTNLTLTSNATTATVVFKAAATFGAGAAKAVLNGGTVATGTNNGSFSTIASFSFSNSTGGSGSINGHFRRVTFYPRVLTNAELQTLTTL